MTVMDSKTRVAVALSGGVSSAVAAALLKSEGYDVFGVHFRLSGAGVPSICAAGAGEEAAREVARRLEIPLHIEDLAEEFEAKVIDPFVHEMLRTRRSWACVNCMREIQFPALNRVAQGSRCTLLATGHYATCSVDPVTGRGRVFRGIERAHDQSFWLHGIAPEIVARLQTPIGSLTSSMVEKLAVQFNLKVPTGHSSQALGRCFEHSAAGKSLVDARAPQSFRQRGAVRMVDGNLAGDHPGLYSYAVGDLYSEAKPGTEQQNLYVVGIDLPGNALIIGTEEHLMRQEVLANRASWLRPVIGMKGLGCRVSFGPGVEPVPCHVTHFEAGVIRVRLESPVRSPQNGRAIVFYEDDEVLGGAIIERSFIA